MTLAILHLRSQLPLFSSPLSAYLEEQTGLAINNNKERTRYEKKKKRNVACGCEDLGVRQMSALFPLLCSFKAGGGKKGTALSNVAINLVITAIRGTSDLLRGAEETSGKWE